MEENTIPKTEPRVNSVASPENEKPLEDLQAIPAQMAELGTYLSSYFEAKGEQFKISARKALLGIGLLPLALLVMAGVLLLGFVFIFYGAAQGLGQLLGGRLWLAYLITGSSLLILIALAFRYVIVNAGKRTLKKQMKLYERELQEQREQFGHDAEERAAQG